MIRSALLALAGLLASLPGAAARDVIAEAARYTVQTSTSVEYAFGSETKGTSRASGFLIDKARGWIATNAHVVERSPSRVRVSFKDKSYVTTEKVYIDNHLDFAILRIDPTQIPDTAIEGDLECAATPKAGTPVIAFGHPWSLQYTATRGIVSATKTLSSVEQLQTDAAINPGNSGGPLIDIDSGRIVGINASGYTNAEGLNFAVPAPLVCTIVDLLKAGKDPAPPFLPASFGLTLGDRDLVISDVKDEWAKDLRVGDRVIAIDGDVNVRNPSRILDKARGRGEIVMEVRRGDEKLKFVLPVPEERDRVRRKGVYLSGMLVGGTTITGAPADKMFVHLVNRASVAEQSQVREGDIIVAIDGAKTTSHDDLVAALRGKSGREVELVLQRARNAYRQEFDYFVRSLEIDEVLLVDEAGVKRDAR